MPRPPVFRAILASLFVITPLVALPAFAQEVPIPATAPPEASPTDPQVIPATPPNAEEISETMPPVAQTEGGEVRAMWIVRDAMTSRARIVNAVKMAKKYGFNTLFVQVRGRGDSFYTSSIEPRSESLADAPADFDPLAVAVEEGHKAGLEVHAWMNTFLVWSSKRKPYSSRHVVNQHPDWIVQDRTGKVHWTDNGQVEGAFLDPALPEVREYTRRVFMEVVQGYAVDGIHFDYVRYPGADYSYSRRSLAEFREYMKSHITPNDLRFADAKAAKNRLAWRYLYPAQWTAWRKANVTATVQGISEEAHRLRPDIIVSAAVFPNYNVASNDKGQCWRDWLAMDLLDAACPMAYNRSTALVAEQIRDAVANSSGKPIIAGVGAWQMPAASAIEKGHAYRKVGAAGINFFSYNGMTREGRTERYLQKVGLTLFPSRSVPPNWRRGAKRPVSPTP